MSQIIMQVTEHCQYTAVKYYFFIITLFIAESSL